MDDLDFQLSQILDISHSVETQPEGISLREAYQKRLEQLGLSDRQAQIMMGVEKNSLTPILECTAKQPNLIVMLKLGFFLGLSIEQVVKSYIPQMSVSQIGEIEKARCLPFLYEHFDLPTLKKEGIIAKDLSAKEIGEQIATLFGLNSIYDFAKLDAGVAYSLTRITPDEKMRRFWVNSALCQFRCINNPHPYNREHLLLIIPKIRPYTRDEDHGLSTVMKALYYCGVTVIYQKPLARTGVRGATLVVNNKPCIVISDHFKKYPTLWFSLIHELYHVLYDIEDIATRAYHLSGSEDLFLINEDDANRFASSYFADESRMAFIKPYLQSPLLVEKYAREWGIHPSLIYAISCYADNSWSLYNKHIPSTAGCLKFIPTDTFAHTTLKAQANIIKKIYETI